MANTYHHLGMLYTSLNREFNFKINHGSGNIQFPNLDFLTLGFFKTAQHGEGLCLLDELLMAKADEGRQVHSQYKASEPKASAYTHGTCERERDVSRPDRPHYVKQHLPM